MKPKLILGLVACFLDLTPNVHAAYFSSPPHIPNHHPHHSSSFLLTKLEDWTHSIATDLRTAFESALIYSTRSGYHKNKRAGLVRKRDSAQAALSSEYCVIGVARPGTNLSGNDNNDNNDDTNNNNNNNNHDDSNDTDHNDHNGTTINTEDSFPEPTVSPSYDPEASATFVSGAPEPTETVSSPSSEWLLSESHQGADFFEGWDFFSASDPTHGAVNYVPADVAFESGLASVTNSRAFMRLETTQTVQDNRRSVRITTRSQYSNGALFMMDVVHMPTGCAVWPAWWTNGAGPEEWPAYGEIDIIEGVGDYTNNQATLHTAPGCILPSDDSARLGMTGTVIEGTDCSVGGTDNRGCGIRARESNSFGAALNNAGGGVYAMLWTSQGISVYFFPRGDIPSDIEDGAPDPDSWGLPMARWPTETCSAFDFFQRHSAIINTTLCGDWAAAVWTSSGIPGQEESCASKTGFSTCEEFVRQRGDAFTEAYWEINWVRIFKQES